MEVVLLVVVVGVHVVSQSTSTVAFLLITFSKSNRKCYHEYKQQCFPPMLSTFVVTYESDYYLLATLTVGRKPVHRF